MNHTPKTYGSNGLAKSLRDPDDKPPVTEAHRREDFAQMKWQHRGYAETMADPVYSKIVEIRATLIRNREYWAAKGGERGQPAQAPEQPARRTQHNFRGVEQTPALPK